VELLKQTNVGLEPEALSLATPRRDSMDALVDYLKNPTTLHGLESIARFTQVLRVTHPRMRVQLQMKI
jgi:photosystem II cytochrome c550